MTKKKTTTATKPASKKAEKINLPAIFKAATGKENATKASDVLAKFPPGLHTGNIFTALANGRADIRGLLYYLAATYQPKTYLEIGVRLGYSMAMVASGSPDCSIVGVDSWIPNFGREANGSPESVGKQLKALGCHNSIEFLSDDSQAVLLPRFKANSQETFDLILIDAGNTTAGAFIDLKVTLPQLNPGGFLIFDDLNSSALAEAWEAIQEEESGLEYYSEGVVGLAYRKGE